MVFDRRLDSWVCVSFTCEIVAVTTMDAATVVVSVAVLVLSAMEEVVTWAVEPPVDDCVAVCVDELCP